MRKESTPLACLVVEELHRDWLAGAHPECCVSHDASWERLRGDGGFEKIFYLVSGSTRSCEKFR
jgi:hypothetical protein